MGRRQKPTARDRPSILNSECCFCENCMMVQVLASSVDMFVASRVVTAVLHVATMPLNAPFNMRLKEMAGPPHILWCVW